MGVERGVGVPAGVSFAFPARREGHGVAWPPETLREHLITNYTFKLIVNVTLVK